MKSSHNYLVVPVLVFGFFCSFANSQNGNQSSPTPTTTAASQNSCPDFCTLKPDPGTRGKTPFRRWYYNGELKECKRFSHGGRGGNKNRFLKKIDCESTCGACSIEAHDIDTCTLPMDPGRCDSAGTIPNLLWYFDSDTDLCQPFAYAGCGGNENKFDSQAKCQATCGE